MEERGLAGILDQAVRGADVSGVIPGGEGLEVACRRTEQGRIYFVMNFSDMDRKVPSCFAGQTDLLSGKAVPADIVLKKYDVCIFQQYIS